MDNRRGAATPLYWRNFQIVKGDWYELSISSCRDCRRYKHKTFLRFQRKIKKIGLFLDIFENQLAIGKKRYASKFENVINKALSTSTECSISLFNTLEEVEAFVQGFCLSTGKKLPF